MWTLYAEGDDVIVECGFQPTCYLCGDDMVVWNIKKLHFDQVHGSGDKKCHAMDVEMTCPACHLEDVFGVAISENEFQAMNVLELVQQ